MSKLLLVSLSSLKRRRAARIALFAPLGTVALAVLAYLMGVSFGPLDDFMGRWAILIVELGGGVACIARAILVPAGRRAWTCVAIATPLWALGDPSFRIFLYTLDSPPVPSPADAG